MAIKEIKPKFSFDGIDPHAIDPDHVDLGMNQQDCALIASTFERGAHSTPTEAAVFATITRTIQNNKQMAQSIQTSLSTYLQAPQEDAATASSQAEQFASQAEGQGGTSVQTDHTKQAINVGTQSLATFGESFGGKLFENLRDCIPCDLRIDSFLELHPHIDMLGSLESYLLRQLLDMQHTADLLTNFDIYGDFCDLQELLSFMCIPDLQRIIALLMSLFTLQVPQLDGMIGLLQNLVAPIFTPILMQITALMDQFVLLVTNPLECVVDAINMQINKLDNTEIPQFKLKIDPIDLNEENSSFGKVNGALRTLQSQVKEGIFQATQKLQFYQDQMNAILDEMGGTDAAYLELKLQSLQLVRTIGFVRAIMNAVIKGHAMCSQSESAGPSEIDNFFKNYLNPNSAFNLYVDDAGQIHIDEKVEGFEEAIQPLPEFGNVFQFEGEPLLDTSVAETVETISSQLSTPAKIVVPCKLDVTSTDLEQVNSWISELNKG